MGVDRADLRVAPPQPAWSGWRYRRSVAPSTESVLRALIGLYAAQVHDAREAVANALGLEDPGTALQVLRERTWSGEVPRVGTLAGGHEYAVHGRIGVCLSWPSGVEVDVDSVDGVDTFDPWKLRWFGQFGVDPPVNVDVAVAQCLLDTMVEEGSLTMAGSYYVVPRI